MKIFIDSANLQDIESALKRGFIRGITTNPSLLAKEPKTAFEAHIGKIIALVKEYQPGISLSVEVFSRDPKEILEQALRFYDKFDYEELAIKVQIGFDELEIIHRLAREGIKVNCTACMTIKQAVMAAAAGARFVSLFWGRIRDGGLHDEKNKSMRDAFLARHPGALEEQDYDPHYVVRSTRSALDREYPNVKIIAGSMRTAADVKNAGLAGAHIITVPPKFFPAMAEHFKTDEVVNQFLTDFARGRK